MDAFILLMSLAAASLAFVLAASLKGGKKRHARLPPGSFGWPVMGETIDFLFGKPENFVFDRMRKYSADIFKTRILGENTAVICGPNGHKFLFSNEHKLFTTFRPHSMQRLFRSTKATNDNPVSNEHAKMLKAPGFLKPDALVRYLGKMDSITQQQMKTYWEGRSEVKVFPLAKSLTLTFSCRFFLGIEDPERIASLVKNFDDVTMGMHSIMLDIPGTVFHKAQKAAAVIREELRTVINEKKAAISNGTPIQDILSRMIMATNPTGKNMPEAEVADNIMGLLTAGYSTMATAMTFFMKYVGESPNIYKKVLQEQMEVAAAKQPGEMLEWDDLQKMKYSWNVMNEVMRLMPPVQGTFREVLTDFTYAGYNIPKGWKVYWSVSTTNKNPEYFPDPEKFDPSRYDDGTQKLPSFTFVPFGGGPRMCPGKEYARLAILTFIHHVVKRFEWELMDIEEKVVGDMTPMPQKGLPIRLRQH